VELQTGATKVRMDRMSNLRRVNLVDCVSGKFRAGTEEKLQRALWLCWRWCASAGCTDILSLAQGLNCALPNPRIQGVFDMKRVRDGGRRLENRRVSVLYLTLTLLMWRIQ
jgi:hypothetical protein